MMKWVIFGACCLVFISVVVSVVECGEEKPENTTNPAEALQDPALSRERRYYECRPWGFRKCCGRTPYDYRFDVCCEDWTGSVLYQREPNKVCCGVRYVTLGGRDVCCHGNIFPKDDNKKCCGGSYIDMQGKVCCDGEIYTQDSWKICCGQDYVRELGNVCCGKKLYNRDLFKVCCGGKYIKKSVFKKCCDGNYVEASSC